MENKLEEEQTKIYMKNTDCGDLGIPEIYPAQEIRGKLNPIFFFFTRPNLVEIGRIQILRKRC